MSSFKLKHSRATRNLVARRRVILTVTIVAILSIALAITTIFLVRSGRRMAESRGQIEDAILSDLSMIVRTYDRFSEAKADIGGVLLPEINKHIYSAYSQDMVLIDLHGAGASIFSNELYSNMTEAIGSIERDIKADRIITAGSNALTPYIVQIQEILDARQGIAQSG